jgi:Rab5 GDP/GTP exchange factor
MLMLRPELLKVNSYRAPRDKVICVLNSCKVIFGFLRSAQSDQSADSFVPLLIYTVLQANPEHLVSNVQYILRFRNQDKLGGEAGYYISSLMGAIQFIEALDRTSLTVTDADFEKNVEAAVSAIAERHSAEGQRPSMEAGPSSRQLLQPSPQIMSEKSALSRAEVTPRNSLDAERIQPNRSPSRRTAFRTEVVNDPEEDTAVAGLLRTIQKPLSTIGRIFSDDGEANTNTSTTPPNYPGRAPATPRPPASASASYQNPTQPVPPPRPAQPSPQRMNAEDAAALQASAEAEQARKLQAKEHEVVVETLQGMFPGLDRDVIDDVVRMKEGR